MNIVFQYAVKFVCGKADGEILAPGRYWTAINVHNPTERTISFRKKVAVALPAEEPGPVSQFFDAKLGPDEAFEIDCRDIRQHSEYGADFMKGFVVIVSSVELDVVAVYTAAGRGDEGVETFHTERVPARQIRLELPDLVPVPDENGFFCKLKDDCLIVTVRNQGGSGAGPSTTRVDFGNFGVTELPTPPLAPGASVDLCFTIPRGCFNPDCDFRITVDVYDNVAESNESNNYAQGTCIG